LPESDGPLPMRTAPPPPPSPGKKKQKSSTPKPSPLPGHISMKEKWGFEFRTVPFDDGQISERARLMDSAGLELPERMDWHSPTVFTNLSTEWQAVYVRGTNPVVVERKMGLGSVVLATDSYLLSNEALLKDRQSRFLAWLVGPNHQVLFDEAHFGIVESSGVATLVRKYRLHGIAAGLLLLAGLFIWKNSLSFLPPYPESDASDQVLGKQASAGFVNLLRRNIRPADVLGVCFDQWTNSLLRGSSHLIARVDQAQAIIEAESTRAKTSRDPVHAYREICRVLKGSTQKNHEHNPTP